MKRVALLENKSRQCRDCLETFPLSAFYIFLPFSHKHWYATRCKKCRRVHLNKLAKKHRKTKKESREYRTKRRFDVSWMVSDFYANLKQWHKFSFSRRDFYRFLLTSRKFLRLAAKYIKTHNKKDRPVVFSLKKGELTLNDIKVTTTNMYDRKYRKRVDYVGRKKGRLVVIRRGRIAGRKYTLIVKCTCGTTKQISISSFNDPGTYSCGCYWKEIMSRPNLRCRKTYIGQIFNKLKVLKERYLKNKRSEVCCKCKCGTVRWFDKVKVTSGHTRSCGCAYKDMGIKYRKAYVGKTFGYLVVIKERYIKGLQQVYCKCKCGRHVWVKKNNLKSGNTKSCGCLQIEHPARTTHGKCKVNGRRNPTYSVWCSLSQKVNNKNHPDYKYYGQKGIKVCKRWKRFENFLLDMGERPSSDYAFVRKNNIGDFKPSNCRWILK
jgi:hypothetical protein